MLEAGLITERTFTVLSKIVEICFLIVLILFSPFQNSISQFFLTRCKTQKKPCDFKSEKVNAGKNWASNNKSNPRSRRHNYDKRTDGKGKTDASLFVTNNKKLPTGGHLSGKFNSPTFNSPRVQGEPAQSSSSWGYDSNKAQKNGAGVHTNPNRYDLRIINGSSQNVGGRGGGSMSHSNMGHSNMGHANMGQASMGQANIGHANMGRVNMGSTGTLQTPVDLQTTMQQLMQQNMQMQQQMNQMMGMGNMGNSFQAGQKRDFGHGNNNSRGNSRGGKRGRW